MTHPLEHLAGAVDGTLTPTEREVVVEHLRSCASCRGEVRVAAAARTALEAMPELETPDLAAGFTPDRIAALTSTKPSRWSKAVPALAAAAVVAVVALVVPRLGTSPNDATVAVDEPALAEIATDAPVRLQLEDTDYDGGALKRVATELTATLTAEAADSAAGVEASSGASAPNAISQQRFAGGKTKQAVACLNEAFPGYPGVTVQVRQAAFEGVPAYLAVVLESTPQGDALSIWVAAIEDCSILTLVSDRL